MSSQDILKHHFSKTSSTSVLKDEWIVELETSLPLYQHLPESLRAKLHHKIGQFICTTQFEAHEALELTEGIVLSVAAQACILVLNHDDIPYPDLHTVRLYPSAFESVIEQFEDDGSITETIVECEGEAWDDGTVLLAWDSVRNGAIDMRDGENVVLHEFAHQLDARDGDIDGVPLLENEAAYHTWAGVLGENAADLIDRIQNGDTTVLDPYAATNPAEYFAVATETFFEKPHKLKAMRPQLYAELQNFYQLDPCEWLDPA